MKDNKIKPTTLMLGEKANQLLHEMARENGLAARYFFTKIIIREARSEATMLTADKLAERLKLIDEVNDELVELINNPPKTAIADRETSTEPKKIYAKIWDTHKRLERKGWTAEQIHNYCISMYGMDRDIKKTPTKNPKRNPEWCGGGKVAAKIKQARENSRKIEVQDGKDLA